MTQNAQGEWRSADFIKIERAKLLTRRPYRSELKRRLEALGYAAPSRRWWEACPVSRSHGYDRATITAFSTVTGLEALAWVKDRNLDSGSAGRTCSRRCSIPANARIRTVTRGTQQHRGEARMAELRPRNRHMLRAIGPLPTPGSTASAGILSCRRCRQPAVPLCPPCGPPGGGASSRSGARSSPQT